MNEGYRYADWLITVPLLVIELLIVLGVASDQRKQLMKTLVPATVLMIGLSVTRVEVADSTSTKRIFWVLAMIPFVHILYTLYGSAPGGSRAREQRPVSAAIKNATMVLLITWLVYLIAHLFLVFDAEHLRHARDHCVRSVTPSPTSPPRACTA